MQSTSNRYCAIALAAIAWFSIVLQLYLTTGSLSNFLSYFTVLCNLLIAVSLTFASLAPNTRAGVFFSLLSVQSAIALYIFIVCLVYNTVLRGILTLTGWHYFVDNMLHVVVPILYILYWLFFRTTGTLKWQDGLYWVFFPITYLIYSLIRGSIVGWYPYPFLNAAKLGYEKVFLNIAVMVVIFLVAGLALIFMTRSLTRKEAA